MSIRTIITYYDIDRGRWCTEDAAPLIERQWPYLNLWETPCLVINLLNSKGIGVAVDADSTFSLLIADKDDNTIAVPIIGHVNSVDDYEDVDPTLGIMSFVVSLGTVEANTAITGYYNVPVGVYLTIENPLTGWNLNLAGMVKLNKIIKADQTPVPVEATSQYRVNPTDGGTDVWDYGLSAWMRPILQNGVLSYVEAPS